MQVRLPSTVAPVAITATKGVSCQDLLQQITDEFKIQDPSERQLVVAPTSEDMGRVLKKTDLILAHRDEVEKLSTG